MDSEGRDEGHRASEIRTLSEEAKDCKAPFSPLFLLASLFLLLKEVPLKSC